MRDDFGYSFYRSIVSCNLLLSAEIAMLIDTKQQDMVPYPRGVSTRTTKNRPQDSGIIDCPNCGTLNDNSYTYCRECIADLRDYSGPTVW